MECFAITAAAIILLGAMILLSVLFGVYLGGRMSKGIDPREIHKGTIEPEDPLRREQEEIKKGLKGWR